MAFTPIASGDVDSNSPLDTDLHGLVKSNFDDHESRILDAEASIAGFGGGGAQYTGALTGEVIDTTNNPKAVCLSQKDCLEIAASQAYIDIIEGAGSEVSTQIFSTDKTFLLYDLDTADTHTADAFDLCRTIEDALNDNVSLSYTYTCTFDEDTRKITINSSSSITLKHQTGTNGSFGTGNHLTQFLKFRDKVVIGSGSKYINFSETSGEVTATLTEATYYEGGDGFSTLLTELKTQLESAGSLTYTPTWDSGTDKFTITGSASNTLLFKTGTNGSDNSDDHAGTVLGYDDSADTSNQAAHVADDSPTDQSGTSFEADYEIDNANNTAYVQRTFITKTDSSLIVKSRNFDGFVSTGSEIAKMSTPDVKILQELAVSGFDPGEEYWTEDSGITIDSTNNYLDIAEGTGELGAVIGSGVYYRGSDSDIAYRGLCGEIKSALESVGSLTYIITQSKDTNKFKFAADGSFSLKASTGSNVANGAWSDLGYNATDTGSATSHTANNAIDLVGEIVTFASADDKSVFVGKAITATNFFPEKNYSRSDYDSIITSPRDWKQTPDDKDYSEEFQFMDQDFGSTGKGCRLIKTYTSPATFKFQYDTGNSVFQDSASTVTVGTPGAKTGSPPEDFGGEYFKKSWVKVDPDDNDNMVAALLRYNTSSSVFQPHYSYSTDGGKTWSSATALTGTGQSYYIGGIDINGGKCAILVNSAASNDSEMYYSNNSGSGYTSFSSTINLTNDYKYNVPSGVKVIYNSSWTGDDRWKIICAGQANTDSDIYTAMFDGAGANEEIDKPFGTDNRRLYDIFVDSGTSNKVVVVGWASGSTTLDVAVSDNVDGSITWTEGDINSGGSNIDTYNGYSSANDGHLIWNTGGNRGVMYGDFIYIVAQTDANTGSKKELGFFYSKDGGTTWETKIDIGQDQNNQECCIAYIPSIHSLVVAYKYLSTAAVSANLSNGQVFARIGKIQGDGDITWYDAEQIDGGELESGFQGFLTLSATSKAVIATFEHYDSGDTYDHLWSNILR